MEILKIESPSGYEHLLFKLSNEELRFLAKEKVGSSSLHGKQILRNFIIAIIIVLLMFWFDPDVFPFTLLIVIYAVLPIVKKPLSFLSTYFSLILSQKYQINKYHTQNFKSFFSIDDDSFDLHLITIDKIKREIIMYQYQNKKIVHWNIGNLATLVTYQGSLAIHFNDSADLEFFHEFSEHFNVYENKLLSKYFGLTYFKSFNDCTMYLEKVLKIPVIEFSPNVNSKQSDDSRDSKGYEIYDKLIQGLAIIGMVSFTLFNLSIIVYNELFVNLLFLGTFIGFTMLVVIAMVVVMYLKDNRILNDFSEKNHI